MPKPLSPARLSGEPGPTGPPARPPSPRARSGGLMQFRAVLPMVARPRVLGHRHVTTTQIYDKRRRSLKEGASHDVPI